MLRRAEQAVRGTWVGPLPPLCIHSIPGSFSQPLLSLQAQKFLTDAVFMELFMAIIFTLKFFPRAPCECAGSSRNLNTAFLCSQASLPWCPRHTVTVCRGTAPGRMVCHSSSGMRSGRTALVWEGHPLSISGRRFWKERQTHIISMLPTDSLTKSSLGTHF